MSYEPTSHAREAVVVGAGPAGLAAAAMLQKAGVDVVIVDQASQVGASWRTRYDRFILNTSRRFSYLPGSRFPREAGRWPTRHAVVAYLERYAELNQLELQLETTVQRIDRHDDGWRVRTSRGSIAAAVVIVATGKYHTPVIPSWPGRESFQGELVHSCEYRSAQEYQGRDVLVVGSGNTGLEIVVQLARDVGGRTRVAVRTPPHIVIRNIGPVPIDAFGVLMRYWPPKIVDAIERILRRLLIGDLSPYGLPNPPDGIYTHVLKTGRIPSVDGPFVKALRERRVEVVAAVDHFEGGEVVLSDGSRIAPEVVIAATGYHRDLEPLVGHLGVLGSDGAPLVTGAKTHERAPGLYFAGQMHPFSGPLREFRLEARKIARAVAKSRPAAPAPRPRRPAAPDVAGVTGAGSVL